MKRSISVLVAGLILMGFVSTAWATQFYAYDVEDWMQVSTTYFGQTRSVYAGAVELTIDGKASLGYCLEYADVLYVPGTYSGQMAGLNYYGADFGLNASFLMNKYTTVNSVSTNAGNAAVQLAIWELLYKENFSFTSSNAEINRIYKSCMDDLAAGIGDWNGTGYSIGLLLQPDAQDLLVNQSAPVPEPASMILLGSGLLGLASFRKKIKK